MSSSTAGLVFLLLFALSQGVRDALFGNVFQSVSFLLVAAFAFGTSTVCFSGSALLRRSGDFRRLAASPAMFAALNVMTAGAWLSFFFGLKHLEPAVAATLYNGIGPLAALALGALGWTRAESRPSFGEWLCYGGLAGVLAALVYVVLTNRSGLAVSSPHTQATALLAVAGGGVAIAVGHMNARWFNDRGVGSDAVMGTRFLLTLCLSVGIEVAAGETAMRPPLGLVPLLALTAFVVVTIPSFMLQLGIARASPLAVNVIRSLGPVSVFAVQQFDGRLKYSAATLLCIAGFCFFATTASLLRAWSEIRSRRDTPLAVRI
jgi:drug/metabolite transporter (DMT)-like permease